MKKKPSHKDNTIEHGEVEESGEVGALLSELIFFNSRESIDKVPNG